MYYQAPVRKRGLAPYKTYGTALARRPTSSPVRGTGSRTGRQITQGGKEKPRRVYIGFRNPTRRPKRRYGGVVRRSATGSTMTSSTFGSKRLTKELYSLYKNNQDYERQVLMSRRQTAAFGKQSVVDQFYNFQGELEAMFATVPQITTPIQRLSGKFYLKNTRVKQTYTNQDLATAYLTIYELTPRFHISTPALTNTPTNLWDEGFEDQLLTPTANDDYRDVYASPFDSQAFTLYYKVDKVTKVELGQGQSHCHTTTYHINKPVYGQILSNYNLLRGIAKCNMLVVSGTPLNDLNVKSNVSTSSVAVDVVTYYTTEYTYAASQRKLRTYTNTLGVINTAELVSVGAGLVTPEDEA